jgi:hypothetical protein
MPLPKTSSETTPQQEPKTGKNRKKQNPKQPAAAKGNVTITSNTTALLPTNAGLLPEARNGTTSNSSLSQSSAAVETFLNTTNSSNATETAVPNSTNETMSNMTLSQEATNETAATNMTVPTNKTGDINATLPTAVESPPEANTTSYVPGEATNENYTSNVTSAPLATESMPQETSNGTTITSNMTSAVPPIIAESTAWLVRHILSKRRTSDAALLRTSGKRNSETLLCYCRFIRPT